ncbi:Uncharacterized protein FWK35_00023628 [Aphis craccivora]|uniref:Uncharacterized protein n=1 Tax=Aphis craccivora TaxID=307492 RepID=A0A6G0ZQ30_APHCR|nr:Uncharacterized protein FWK35_00023628 [Aphis craccivora]
MNKQVPTICVTRGVHLYIKHILTKCLIYEVFGEKSNFSYHISTSLSNSQDATNAIVDFNMTSMLINKL